MHTENTKEFRYEVYKAALVIYEQTYDLYDIGICQSIWKAIRMLYEIGKISKPLYNIYGKIIVDMMTIMNL